MKIIQIPYCFYPDPIGGTEVYVEGLSKCLQKGGVDVVISAPTLDESKTYFYNDLKVCRFKISGRINDLAELYGEGDAKAALEFAKILDEEKPDIVHLHAFTFGVSLRLVREAKKRKIPVVYTYHTPTVSCQRGTLIRWGRRICDGKVGLHCAACTLHGLGLPRPIADIIGLTPVGLGDLLGKLQFSGGIWTALRMRSFIGMRLAVFYEFMEEVSHIVVLCKWTKNLLLSNGIPLKKITIIRQGLLKELLKSVNNRNSLVPNKTPVKIAYFGRLSQEKGVDIVIKAIRSLGNAPLEFYIYGVVQGDKESMYFDRLKKLSANDSRIKFMSPVPNEKIISIIKNYDLVTVPSRCLETGPLIVLEAFAAGVPAMGSNLGGISELIENEINGLLVEFNSIKSWCKAFKRILEDRHLIYKLQQAIKHVRTIGKVAEENLHLYECLRNKNMELCRG